MSDEPVELDSRRGMSAQKATDLRRLLADAEAQASVLRERQSEIETKLRDTLVARGGGEGALHLEYLQRNVERAGYASS